MTSQRSPTIIQGGMGVGVSGWALARAVARAGQLGIVSGVGLDTLLARRLQLGDPGGDVRRGLEAFPYPEVNQAILQRYFVKGGIAATERFRPVPLSTMRPTRAATELAVAANFVEVYLAKEGHHGLVGVNYLEKLQMATPAALYGAMLAGADYVIVGAGIPAEIPQLLDRFASGKRGWVTVSLQGQSSTETYKTTLDPAANFGAAPRLRRPRFLAVIASNMLASYLARDPRTRPEGFIVEGPLAGGHSARPRGRPNLDAHGQPVYGPRDLVDLSKMSALGLPYWLAGAQASPARLAAALAGGAAGIQVGSAFALCEESALGAEWKQTLIEQALATKLEVRADPVASPTGFPLKVAALEGTVGDPQLYAQRRRVCDVGYLRQPYRQASGTIGYRCPAEPIRDYLRKGGDLADALGRRCVCNGLISTIGLAQRRRGSTVEPPLVTIGQDLSFLPGLTKGGTKAYRARDVIDFILSGNEPRPAGVAKSAPGHTRDPR